MYIYKWFKHMIFLISILGFCEQTITLDKPLKVEHSEVALSSIGQSVSIHRSYQYRRFIDISKEPKKDKGT